MSPNDLPTNAGFARRIGISRDTLHEWEAWNERRRPLKRTEFSDSYTRLKDMHEDHLVQNALRGHFNPQFSIFFENNCLGDRYKDKTETDVRLPLDGATELARLMLEGAK